MAVGRFTDREAALAAVDELLAPDTAARLLMLFGVTGQGKTRLLDRVVELHARRFRPVRVDLQSLVLGGLGGRDDALIAARIDDVAVLLLREIAAGLARQAPWWQLRWLRRLADQVGADAMSSRVDARQVALFGGRIADSPQTIQLGAPMVATARRRVWIGQVAAIAQRIRRRRVLLVVDTCEWMYVFDAAHPADGPSGTAPTRPLGMSSWFTGQALPALLDAAPRLNVILAGWDELPMPTTIPTAKSCRLTGWSQPDTRAFLTSAGVEDPVLLDTLVGMVHPADDDAEDRDSSGLPLIAAVLAEVEGNAGGAADEAELLRIVRRQPAARWVPERILGRLGGRQRVEVVAAAVLREITLPALRALLPDTPRADSDWFTRLTGRATLQQIPPEMGSGQLRWRMHRMIRNWLLDYLASSDAEAVATEVQLPALHRRAAAYFMDLTSRGAPGAWLEAAYHCFALGDDTPAAEWQRQTLTAARAGQVAAVAAHIEVALAPEQAQPVRTRLPSIAATALACSAWVEHFRGRYDVAERQALDAASLYQQIDQPAGHAWAWQLAGQAAWIRWNWASAAAHWAHALEVIRAVGTPAELLTILTALAEATLGSGDLHFARAILNEARTLLGDHSTPVIPAAAPENPDTPPPVPLATAVPAGRLPARLALFAADASLRTADRDGREQASQLLDHADRHAVDDHDRIELLRLRAELALAFSDYEQAGRFADEAADAVLAAGHDAALRLAVLFTQAAAEKWRMRMVGNITRSTALIVWRNGQLVVQEDPIPRRFAEAALALARDTGNRHAQARALNALGAHNQARAMFEQIGDRLGLAEALLNLARNDDDPAQSHLTQAADIYGALGLTDLADDLRRRIPAPPSWPRPAGGD